MSVDPIASPGRQFWKMADVFSSSKNPRASAGRRPIMLQHLASNNNGQWNLMDGINVLPRQSFGAVETGFNPTLGIYDHLTSGFFIDVSGREDNTLCNFFTYTFLSADYVFSGATIAQAPPWSWTSEATNGAPLVAVHDPPRPDADALNSSYAKAYSALVPIVPDAAYKSNETTTPRQWRDILAPLAQSSSVITDQLASRAGISAQYVPRSSQGSRGAHPNATDFFFWGEICCGVWFVQFASEPGHVRPAWTPSGLGIFSKYSGSFRIEAIRTNDDFIYIPTWTRNYSTSVGSSNQQEVDFAFDYVVPLELTHVVGNDTTVTQISSNPVGEPWIEGSLSYLMKHDPPGQLCRWPALRLNYIYLLGVGDPDNFAIEWAPTSWQRRKLTTDPVFPFFQFAIISQPSTGDGIDFSNGTSVVVSIRFGASASHVGIVWTIAIGSTLSDTITNLSADWPSIRADMLAAILWTGGTNYPFGYGDTEIPLNTWKPLIISSVGGISITQSVTNPTPCTQSDGEWVLAVSGAWQSLSDGADLSTSTKRLYIWQPISTYGSTAYKVSLAGTLPSVGQVVAIRARKINELSEFGASGFGSYFGGYVVIPAKPPPLPWLDLGEGLCAIGYRPS